jgi:hypothetical protein
MARRRPAECIYVALDIEKCGPMMSRHPVVSIGYCVGNRHGRVYQLGKFNLHVKWPEFDASDEVVDWGDFEPACWRQFWSHQPSELLFALQINTMTQADGFTEFARWLHHLETVMFPRHRIVFVSDNPSFDIGTIDYNLERYCGQLPVRYSRTCDVYRQVQSPVDMVRGMQPGVFERGMRALPAPYMERAAHDPASDAEHVYRMMLTANRISPRYATRAHP